jgi:hypothetical protein
MAFGPQAGLTARSPVSELSGALRLTVCVHLRGFSNDCPVFRQRHGPQTRFVSAKSKSGPLISPHISVGESLVYSCRGPLIRFPEDYGIARENDFSRRRNCLGRTARQLYLPACFGNQVVVGSTACVVLGAHRRLAVNSRELTAGARRVGITWSIAISSLPIFESPLTVKQNCWISGCRYVSATA